jgi:hypothetical protein
VAIGSSGKIIIVSGSPCQDLSNYGPLKGILGLAGKRSYNMMVVHATLTYFTIMGMIDRVFIMIEKAGSMEKVHLQDFKEFHGFVAGIDKRINPETWGWVRRSRVVFTRTNGLCDVEKQDMPWDDGWFPLLVPEKLIETDDIPTTRDWIGKDNTKCRILMPWLRSRGTNEKGDAILTSAAYHPVNLLYNEEAFNGLGGLVNHAEDIQKGSKFMISMALWDTHIPEAYRVSWDVILSWDIKADFRPNDEQDLAAKHLSAFFCNPSMNLPFRPPNLRGK